MPYYYYYYYYKIGGGKTASGNGGCLFGYGAPADSTPVAPSKHKRPPCSLTSYDPPQFLPLPLLDARSSTFLPVPLHPPVDPPF
jgi:hypothetical protein